MAGGKREAERRKGGGDKGGRHEAGRREVGSEREIVRAYVHAHA